MSKEALQRILEGEKPRDVIIGLVEGSGAFNLGLIDSVEEDYRYRLNKILDEIQRDTGERVLTKRELRKRDLKLYNEIYRTIKVNVGSSKYKGLKDVMDYIDKVLGLPVK